MRSIALFGVLFCFFALWSLSRPPFQSPDEFAHLIKAQSTATEKWMTSGTTVRLQPGITNPLADHRALHRLPFHPDQKLSLVDVEQLRTLTWQDAEHRREHEIGKGQAAFRYPPLYYLAVFALGQSATTTIALGPYESFFAYRLASALLAALAWTWVYRRLDGFGAYRGRIFAFLVLIPGVAFLSSSVNPDALLIPIATVGVLLFQRSLHNHRGWVETGTALLLAAFIKPTGIVLLPALACVLLTLALIQPTVREDLRAQVLPVLATLVGPAVVLLLGFYAWSSLTIVFDPVSLTKGQYAWSVLARIPGLFLGFWGSFGWADYHLSAASLAILTFLLFINGVAFARAWPRSQEKTLLAFCLSFAIFFAVAIFAIELLRLETMGLFLQGRYFLPASLGVAIVVAHPHRRLAYGPIAMLVLLNGFGLALGVERYYDDRVDVFLRAIPFLG